MVKKVITNLDSSKAFGLDCIPAYIIAELFNICLKMSCFPDCWKVSLVNPAFKNVGESSTVKNYHPSQLVFFWWSVKSSNNLKIIGLLIT